MNLSPELSRTFVRVIFGLFFAVVGFASSNRFLFETKPLFNVPFLGEGVFSIAIGLFAVYILPTWIREVISWIRKIIALEVRKIVFDFWSQQSERMSKAKRERQKKKEIKKSKYLVPSLMAVPVILDTSVLIDGRVIEIIKSGFLENPIIVPSFVIDELQKISDSEDDIKRHKGRRGFEVLEKVKELSGGPKGKNYRVLDLDIKGKEVDKELVKLARKIKAKIATVDFNLNKAAGAKGVPVLNINDLAGGLRIDLIPGEKIEIKIVQKGKEDEQGVGYLPDGTMIVVEDGGYLVGKRVEVEIRRAFQTSAGRMFFARRVVG